MARDEREWPDYVPVAERRRRAERAMQKLRKTGHPVAPVTITGRAIAATFWGRAWCDTMESFHDYESRLPRGRTYVRNGSVIDLQIAPGLVGAIVSGSELYKVTVTVKPTPAAQWQAICADCMGGIDSMVELLQGRFSKGVMERLCRQGSGLFPRVGDMRFSCDCLDHATMCKHVAAVLYGIGARLDAKPDLLFRLRAVDEVALLAGIDRGLVLPRSAIAAKKLLQAGDIPALFGIDMAPPQDAAAPKPAPASGVGTPARKPPRAKPVATKARVTKRPARRAALAPARSTRAAADGKRARQG